MVPVRQNPIQRTVRSVDMCALHSAQLLHTILHRTDLIIFPFTLQTITIVPMMSTWGKGAIYIHNVSQKNVPPLQLAIIFTYTVRLRQFFAKCCQESRQSKCTLFSHHTFCTTWGNRKPGNCVFSLKCCMLFHHKTWNTVDKYHLVRAEPPFTVKTMDWVHQTGPRKAAQHPAVCYPHVLC